MDGFLVVLQCATSVALYGPSSRLLIGLGFHDVLLPSSFARLLTVLPGRKIRGLCNPLSSLYIALGFHGVLLSLLSMQGTDQSLITTKRDSLKRGST